MTAKSHVEIPKGSLRIRTLDGRERPPALRAGASLPCHIGRQWLSRARLGRRPGFRHARSAAQRGEAPPAPRLQARQGRKPFSLFLEEVGHGRSLAAKPLFGYREPQQRHSRESSDGRDRADSRPPPGLSNPVAPFNATGDGAEALFEFCGFGFGIACSVARHGVSVSEYL